MSDRGGWFAQLRQAFAGNMAHGIDAVYEFRFDDAPPYHLGVRDMRVDCADGEHTAPTLTVYFDTFEHHRAIIEGRLDPMQAFLHGQFRSDGHIVLAMRLLQLFVPQYALTGPQELL